MKGRYLSLLSCLLLAAALIPQVVQAQTAPLRQHVEPYVVSSGQYDGQEGVSAAVYTAYTHTVQVSGAPWLRLQFGEVELDANSYLTVRSLSDGAEQRLDAEGLSQWYDTSAYFNGDAVEVSLHVAPGDEGVFFRLAEVFVGEHGAPESQCGPEDNRIASNDAKAGRILSVGCTGWLIHDDKVVSAGHCLQSGATTLQFNVPQSLPGGTLQHPGPEDQYSVDASSRVFQNAGVGNDWGVFRVFDNTQTGLQPSVAQGAIFAVRQDYSPPTIRITGYGVDTGSSNQTQQTHTGPNAGSSGTTMAYQVDTTGGNSGSPVIDEATGQSVGVHTHGGCTTANPPGGSNKGTSLFHAAFWDAVGEPPPPMADACFTTLGGGLTANVLVDNPTDIFNGIGSGSTTYQVSGGRGTNNRTLRHHVFDFMNPAAGNDPGCGDGAGVVDWLTFNGRVVSASGGTYGWNGSWRNSCDATGSTTGTITLGACTAPRQDTPEGIEAQAVPQAPARAAVPASDEAAPLVSAIPEGGITYCYTNGLGYEHEGTLDPSTNILYGPGTSGTDRYVHGGRGTSSSETRHHTFVWQSPDADNDPDCTDGAGNTDWFTYNGLVGGSSPSYSFNAVWLSSCGATGTRAGTITLGNCPAPRPGTVASGPEGTVTPEAEASAEVAAAGVAVVSGPNPFRTQATISFALAEPTHVRLTVYDVLGREVAVLVDEAREVGTHSVVFDGGALPAGTYLYRIEAGSYTATKQMTLVR